MNFSFWFSAGTQFLSANLNLNKTKRFISEYQYMVIYITISLKNYQRLKRKMKKRI